jgi:branched-chain amino acid transport system substrate-binding protein
MRRRVNTLAALAACAAVAGSLLVSAAPAGAAKQPVVTIGVIAPLDAGLTSFGNGIANSTQLAVDQANKSKAIPGWKIKVKAVDDSSDGAIGAVNVKQLLGDKSVVGIVGPYNSGVSLQVLPVLDGKLALVSPGNTLTDLTRGTNSSQPTRTDDNYFRVVGADSLQAQFLAQQAKKLGFTKAAVVSETKAVSQGLADQFVTAFKSGGGTVVVQHTVVDGNTNFTDFINSAKRLNPDLIFFGGEYNVAATLRSQATAAGLTAPQMGGDGMNDPAYITGAGPAAAGSYASGVGQPISKIPGSTKFLADYAAAGFKDAPTDFGPHAYDAANAIIAGLKSQLKGKSSLPKNTRAKVIAALQDTKLTGVTGPIAFDQYGDPVSPSFTLYTVSGSPLAWTPVPS